MRISGKPVQEIPEQVWEQAAERRQKEFLSKKAVLFWEWRRHAASNLQYCANLCRPSHKRQPVQEIPEQVWEQAAERLGV